MQVGSWKLEVRTVKRGSSFCIILVFIGIQGLFAQLTEVTGFGSNPGNLKMYTHIPTGMGVNRPLVVVLHGCGQSAQSFADESGWTLLADEYDFALLYPEQKTINNISDCFNWFSGGDIERNQGESASIKNMMVAMVSNYNIDTSRIFITGFSAGACMSAVMMACYPDVFKKGAIMAGTPYKSADGLLNPLLAMNPGINKTASAWGDFVRDAYTSYSGPYPKVAIFQGNSDLVVSVMNETELMQQWTNANNTNDVADITNPNFNGINAVDQTIYLDGAGDTAVLTYRINGMGHAIAVDPGTSNMQGGTTGTYAVDKGFFSSYWAADFFGLVTSPSTEVKTGPKRMILNPPFQINGHLYVPSQNTQLYDIYNLSGILVQKGQITSESIYIESLPQGVYILKLPNLVWRFVKI